MTTTGEIGGALLLEGVRAGILWGGVEYRRLPSLVLLAYEDQGELVHACYTTPNQRKLIDAHFAAYKHQQGK